MLTQRIVSAAIGIIYIFLMLHLGGWFFNISVLIMALILMHEFYHAFIKKGYRPLTWLGYSFVIILFYFCIISYKYTVVVLVSIFILTGLTMPVFFKRVTIMDVLTTMFAVLYPGMMIFFLILLAFKSPPYGMNLLILGFLITWSTDTFAYFLGKTFGRKQLCPLVSPNKTVEGGLGGLVGAMLMGALFGYILNHSFGFEIPLYHFGLMGFVGSIFSQLGDLSASSIKRFCGVKDFGKILPGHGGLLDRFDSLLFSLPIIYIYYLVFLAP
ncbi:MAG TPA: phosphatidate cytidylyltransferase [Clostridia bacterium]|nr:phosphatidate cytidylyltransferase [Clostridia bacterium]